MLIDVYKITEVIPETERARGPCQAERCTKPFQKALSPAVPLGLRHTSFAPAGVRGLKAISGGLQWFNVALRINNVIFDTGSCGSRKLGNSE